MSNPEAVTGSANHAATFAALGDQTRLALIDRLSDGRPQSIMRLTEGLGLSRQGVTKHLRVLEKAGLVRKRREGRESRFLLVPEPVSEASAYLTGVAADWDEALSKLKAFVERD